MDQANDATRQRAQSAFVPASGLQPRQATPELLSIWEAARDGVDDPLVRSRLSDLLFAATGSHTDGLVAGRAYIELERTAGEEAFDRARYLSRALELATLLNNPPLLKSALESAAAAFAPLLADEMPGPSFLVLRALGTLPKRSRPAAPDQWADVRRG
ncbi:MAG: hypothetical protein REI11_11595 [Patulibacter sp.]|nr:hypothetical protein [Patulibacter sp.]